MVEQICKWCKSTIFNAGNEWADHSGIHELKCMLSPNSRHEPAAPEAEPRPDSGGEKGLRFTSWGRVPFDDPLRKRGDIVGRRTLADGRLEYLCHNEAMCEPYYLAVNRLPDGWQEKLNPKPSEPPAVPPAQPEAIAHNASAMPHQNCTGPCCRPDLWEAGIKGRGPQKDVPPAQEPPGLKSAPRVCKKCGGSLYDPVFGGTCKCRKPSPQPASAEPVTHKRNCAAWINEQGHEVNGEDCTCGYRWRVEIQTLHTLKSAWEKRAYEAEAQLAALRESQQECVDALTRAKPYVHDKSAIGFSGPNTACFVESQIDTALANAAKLGGK